VPLGRDDSASAQVLTFLVAGALFTGAVGTVLLVSRGSAQQDRGATEANQEQQADRLADLLVNSPGIGWAAGSDAINRLGLRATNGSGLQASSLDFLRGALFTHTANSKVDYPDARTSLGLTGTQDFHLRIAPVGLAPVYKAADSNIRTGYIGDWVSLATITVPLYPTVEQQALIEYQVNTTMFGLTANERAALSDLGLNFLDRVYLSSPVPPGININAASIEGDVYPDVKDYLDSYLAGRLYKYDLLIVGSGVDQSSLTSSSVKYAIRNWVAAGGTLVVLGSDATNYQWLQPLFSAGVKTANGVAAAPDPSHPLLLEPHPLDWTHYADHGMGWDIKSQSAEGFSNVIVKGGASALVVSNDGALGNGRVILTTYLPREIATTLGQAEAEHFLENMVLFMDHSKLYLEYGPDQPLGLPVSVAVRQSYLYDPTLGQVPVRIEVHYWGRSS
jgi:hypothetical protein